MKLRRASRVYETAPVEVEEYQPDYLNCVAEIECGVPAIELPPLLPGRRVGPGARAQRREAPRTIDVDVLLGEEVIDEPDLEVPHRGSHAPSTSRASRIWTAICISRTMAG